LRGLFTAEYAGCAEGRKELAAANNLHLALADLWPSYLGALGVLGGKTHPL